MVDVYDPNLRVGDYLNGDAGRVIYEAVKCFALANLRVTRIGVPTQFWHAPPGGHMMVHIHGAPVALFVSSPVLMAMTFTFEPA